MVHCRFVETALLLTSVHGRLIQTYIHRCSCANSAWSHQYLTVVSVFVLSVLRLPVHGAVRYRRVPHVPHVENWSDGGGAAGHRAGHHAGLLSRPAGRPPSETRPTDLPPHTPRDRLRPPGLPDSEWCCPVSARVERDRSERTARPRIPCLDLLSRSPAPVRPDGAGSIFARLVFPRAPCSGPHPAAWPRCWCVHSFLGLASGCPSLAEVMVFLYLCSSGRGGSCRALRTDTDGASVEHRPPVPAGGWLLMPHGR